MIFLLQMTWRDEVEYNVNCFQLYTECNNEANHMIYKNQYLIDFICEICWTIIG